MDAQDYTRIRKESQYPSMSDVEQNFGRHGVEEGSPNRNFPGVELGASGRQSALEEQSQLLDRLAKTSAVLAEQLDRFLVPDYPHEVSDEDGTVMKADPERRSGLQIQISRSNARIRQINWGLQNLIDRLDQSV